MEAVSEALTQEIQQLRDREQQWREERLALLQRDTRWTKQWQEREMFFQSREQQWSQALSENQRLWTVYKDDVEQQLKEAEAREQLLLKVLRQEKHVIIEIHKPVSDTNPDESRVQTEQFWKQAFQTREQQWCQVLYQTQTHCNQWKLKHGQLLQDFESSKKEFEKRENLLLKLLEEEKHHLIIEIDRTLPETIQDSEEIELSQEKTDIGQVSEEEQVSVESTDTFVSQASEQEEVICSERTDVLQASEEAKVDSPSTSPNPSDNEHILITFGDFPEDLQVWNDPSVAGPEFVPITLPKTLAKTKITKRKVKKIKPTAAVDMKCVQNTEKCPTDCVITFGDFPDNLKFLNSNKQIVDANEIEKSPLNAKITFGDFPQELEELINTAVVEIEPPASTSTSRKRTTGVKKTKIPKRIVDMNEEDSDPDSEKDFVESLGKYGDFPKEIKFLMKLKKSLQVSEGEELVCPEKTDSFQTSKEESLASPGNSPKPSDNEHLLVTFGDFPKDLQVWNDPSVNGPEFVRITLPKTQAQTKITKRKVKKIKPTTVAVDMKCVQNTEKCPADCVITFGDFPENLKFLNSNKQVVEVKEIENIEKSPLNAKITFGDFPKELEELINSSAAVVEMDPPASTSATRKRTARVKKTKIPKRIVEMNDEDSDSEKDFVESLGNYGDFPKEIKFLMKLKKSFKGN